MDDLYDYQLKILLVGDSGTGKSSLCKQLQYKDFNNKTSLTVGVDFFSRVFEILDRNCNKKIRYKTHIWDTAGQEMFNSLVTSYYRSSHGVLLVFDLNNRQSFINLKKWYDQIKMYSPEKCTILLVGNKCDLKPSVSNDEIDDFCKKYDLSYCITKSMNFKETFNCFQEIIRIIHKKTFIPENVREIKKPLYIDYTYNSTKKCC